MKELNGSSGILDGILTKKPEEINDKNEKSGLLASLLEKKDLVSGKIKDNVENVTEKVSADWETCDTFVLKFYCKIFPIFSFCALWVVFTSDLLSI